jgi:hypothetical protein
VIIEKPELRNADAPVFLLDPVPRAVSIYPDAPKNEKISGGIIRENESGTQKLRRKPLKINSSMWNRDEMPALPN